MEMASFVLEHVWFNFLPFEQKINGLASCNNEFSPRVLNGWRVLNESQET